MGEGFQTEHRWDLEWQDDLDVLTLGRGVQVKVFRNDPEQEEMDMLVKFPPGYTEPEHAHDSEHSIVVLEGLQVVKGEHMRPGDFVFGGRNVVHGPFNYPEGCVVFVTFRGASAQHRYPGSLGGEI